MMPIDKIIGKIYPLFAFALLFMAVGILVMLYVKVRICLKCGMDLEQNMNGILFPDDVYFHCLWSH